MSINQNTASSIEELNSSSTNWNWGEPTDYILSSDQYYFIPKSIQEEIDKREVNWGFEQFSPFIYYSKYSRRMKDGTNESWPDTVLRCTAGSLTLIKSHLLKNHLKFQFPSYNDKVDKDPITITDLLNCNNEQSFAQLMARLYSNWDDVAADMANHIFDMRMLPPGRGLWAMGELAFKRGGAVLNNCGAVSTRDLHQSATWTMGKLMYGCGIGFDTSFKGPVYKPNKKDTFTFIISDDREGWVDSLGHLIRAYVPIMEEGKESCGKFPRFDYSQIRPKGSPIRTFGGTASGSGPLRKLHHRIEVFFDTYLAMQEIDNNDQDAKIQVFVNLVYRLISSDFSDLSDELVELVDISFYLFGYKNEQIDIYQSINKLQRAKELCDLINESWSINLKTNIEKCISILRNIVEEKDINNSTKIDNSINIDDLPEDWHKNIEIIDDTVRDIRMDQIEQKIRPIKTAIFQNIDRKTYDFTRLTVDIMNSIGACVVAGNVRRSSMLASGDPGDMTFRLLKDWRVNPERAKIAYMSNNSVRFTSTEQYTEYLPDCAKQTALNGEPGYQFALNIERYGRIGHPYKEGDLRTRELEADKANLANPCSEIALENYELCCLAELPANRFLRQQDLSESNNIEDMFDLTDFLRSCILAMIYTKSVSILPTDSANSNAVIARNHRVGNSITGASQVHDIIGMTHWIKVQRMGYKIIRLTDRWLSRILGVPESIRVTTVKPSGTVSLLSGSTPGVHFCHSRYVKRRVREAATSKMVDFLVSQGYEHEKAIFEDNTVIFTFGLNYGPVRSTKEVSMYEQLVMLQTYQREWADNMVSVTVTYDPKTEADLIPTAIAQFAPVIKSVSFLPKDEGVYPQMPFEETDRQGYERLNKPIDFSQLTGIETAIPRGCTNDNCIL